MLNDVRKSDASQVVAARTDSFGRTNHACWEQAANDAAAHVESAQTTNVFGIVGTVIYYAACPARCAQGLAASGGGGEGGGRKVTVDVAEPVEPADPLNRAGRRVAFIGRVAFAGRLVPEVGITFGNAVAVVQRRHRPRHLRRAAAGAEGHGLEALNALCDAHVARMEGLLMRASGEGGAASAGLPEQRA